ncbi:MAG: apolipoprotein N-acyltransferase [Rickettsiales bacterium]|nr:apolipoprotein N-acyltransferase [Rickettsiales bacterium]
MKKIKNFITNKLFISFFAGGLCSLAFAPFHFFVSAIISLSFLYFLLEEEKWENKPFKRIFLLGWFYGFGYFLTGVYWITISLLVDAEKFAWLIPFAITLIPGVLAIYFALFAVTNVFLVKKLNLSQNYKRITIFAVLWLIFELLRSFLFTGFPWNLLGYSWFFNDQLVQLASVFSVWGLSFFATLIYVIPSLFVGFSKGKFFRKKPVFADKFFGTILFFLLISGFFYGHHHLNQGIMPADDSKKLRLVQGNIKQELKWDAQKKYENFVKHIELSNSKDLSEVAAVIWSETAVPYAIDNNSDLINKLRLATPKNGVLLTGALRVKYLSSDEIEAVWNSVFAIEESGVIGHYDKHHLVPFGEYVPLQEYLPFISKITDGAVGFSKGNGPETIKTNVLSVSPLLCYEVIFPDKIIDKKDRPDLLVNLTNDAWFGRSLGPYQHFDMARMRSIEYGISLARVANTGITAYFDPFGHVVQKINLDEEGIIDVSFIEKLEPTIYSRFALYPLILLVLLLLIFLTYKPKN